MSTPHQEVPCPQLIDLPQTAKILNCSVSTLRRLIASGSLPCYRIGHGIRFSIADLVEYIDQSKVEIIEQ